MNRCKQSLAAILAILMIVASIPFAPGAVRAFAADALTAAEPEQDIEIEKDFFVPPMPEGYHFTGITYTDQYDAVYYYLEDDPSAYGYIDSCWVDASGTVLDAQCDPDYGTVQFSDSETENLPASYDARDYGLITSVKDQLWPTCWAHAAAANIETSAVKNGLATADEIDLSENQLIWYTYNNYYEGIPASENDGRTDDITNRIMIGGNAQSAGFSLMSLNGPTAESRYSAFDNINIYSINELTNAMTEAFPYSERFVYDYVVTNVENVQTDRDAIKAAVLKYGSAQISYYDDQHYFTKFFNAHDGTPCAYYNPTGKGTGHAVTIVGWDDLFSADNFTVEGAKPMYDGAWLIKNSWGTQYLNDGYFWLSYYEPSIRSCFIYETESADAYQNVYFYDGWRSTRALSSSMAGNIFTSGGDEYLTKVSFGENAYEYSFRIYANVAENAADPTDGMLIYSQNGNAHGKRWIDVFGNVRLTAGERFSVVFDGLSHVRAEGASEYNTALSCNEYYQSKPGESFYYKNSRWIDSSEDGVNNVCIRAASKDAAEEVFTVTYTCPGFFSEQVEAENGVAALPQTEGHTWALTYNGAPFTGVGIEQSCTVLAHCYPNGGTPKADAACTTEYRCIYCGEEVKECVADHRFVDTVFAPTANCLGYTLRVCADCGLTVKDSFTFVPGSANGSLDNFAWQVADGVLSIVGIGDLPDFTAASETPWYAYRNEIASIVLSDDVTSVGKYNFASLSSAQTVSLPDSVAAIGAYAFYGASSLTEFVAPANLTTIGNFAFQNTNALARIAFNDKIATLGSYVFTNCALTDAVLPGTVSSYGSYIYYNCNKIETLTVEEGITTLSYSLYSSNASTAKLKTVVLPSTVSRINPNFYAGGMRTIEEYVVSEDNPYYYTVDGVLYTDYKILANGTRQTSGDRTLLSYPQNKPGRYWKAPADVTMLSKNAFCNNRSLYYLDLSETAISDIPQNCFYSILSLRNIDLPTGEVSLSPESFAYYDLARIYLPDTVTSIDAQTFRNYYQQPVIRTNSASSAAKAFADVNGFDCVVFENHEHAFTQTAYTEDATCLQEGYVIKTCECGNFTAEPVARSGHTKASPVVTEPTCEHGGYTTYTCAVCGTVFTEDETPAIEHSFAWIVDRAATCSETGLKHEECSVCGAVRNENTVIASEHNYKWIVDKAATCGEAGKKHEECAVCGAVRNENTSIAATGAHNYKWIVDKTATCGATGLKHEECSECGAVRSENTAIPATGEHNFTAQTVSPDALKAEATEASPAIYYYSCAACGAVERNDAHIFTHGSVIVHHWIWVIDRGPTCGETGVKHEECSDCGAVRNENTVIAATGEHNYEWITDKAATCGEAGAKHEECAVCGAVKSENTVIAETGEHTYEWIIDKAATCGEVGKKHEKCSVCGAVRNENTIIPATGKHNYKWIVDKAATCGEVGKKHEKCSVCGAVRNENTIIPATGKHNYKWIVDKAATCGEAGAKHEECAVCGAVRNENTVIPATGKHSFGAWVTTKNASCEETGSRYHVCEVCGAKATETIKASGHKDADNDGFCDVCGEDIAPEQNNGQQEQQQSFIQRIIAFFRRIVGIFRSILGGH